MLKAWSALAESGCVPLPLWPQLVQSAAGRLEDSSVMVVKVWGWGGGGGRHVRVCGCGGSVMVVKEGAIWVSGGEATWKPAAPWPCASFRPRTPLSIGLARYVSSARNFPYFLPPYPPRRRL